MNNPLKTLQKNIKIEYLIERHYITVCAVGRNLLNRIKKDITLLDLERIDEIENIMLQANIEKSVIKPDIMKLKLDILDNLKISAEEIDVILLEEVKQERELSILNIFNDLDIISNNYLSNDCACILFKMVNKKLKEGITIEELQEYATIFRMYASTCAYFSSSYLEKEMDFYFKLKPKKLTILLETLTNKVKKMEGIKIAGTPYSSFLNDETILKINELTGKQFKEIVTFLNIDYPKKELILPYLLEEENIKGQVVKKWNRLPLEITNKIIRFCPKEKKQALLASMRDDKYNQVVTSIQNISDFHYEWLSNLMLNDDFINLDINIQIKLLNKLGRDYKGKNSSKKNNATRFQQEMYFLTDYIYSCYLLGEKGIDALIEFIHKDSNISVIEAKEKALRYIEPDLEYANMDIHDFLVYLSYLENGLESKTEEEQVKLLHSRSEYFRKHSFSEFIAKVDSSQKEDIMKLLETDNFQGEKTLKFIEKANLYQKVVFEKIAEHLLNVDTEDGYKEILEKVNNEKFRKKDIKKQIKIINSLPGNYYLLGSNQLEVSTTDWNSLNKVTKKYNTLDFVNPETGLKIAVKKK